MSFGRAARSSAALIGLVLFAERADAHREFPELSGERAIELRLDQQPIRIVYRLSLGPALAEAERRNADQDRNGAVSPIEESSRLDRRTRALLEGLRACLGKSLDELACRALERAQVERVEAQGFVPEASRDLHLSWTFELDRSAAEIGALRFEDALSEEGIAITDVRIAPPEAHPLTLAADSRSPNGVASEFTWIEATRPRGPRVVVAAWPPPPLVSRTALLLALTVSAGVLALLFWRRAKLD